MRVSGSVQTAGETDLFLYSDYDETIEISQTIASLLMGCSVLSSIALCQEQHGFCSAARMHFHHSGFDILSVLLVY